MSTNEREIVNGSGPLEHRRRLEFLHRIFSSQDQGFICLARGRKLTSVESEWEQRFVKLPEGWKRINGIIEEWMADEGWNIYLCPHLLSQPNRKKQFALPGKILWADLDDCPTRGLTKYREPRPQILISTSILHSQAYWILTDDVEPSVYEECNRRIAAAYKDEGCDQCWFLTHMMRMPYTYNYKREISYYIHEIVNVNWSAEPTALSQFATLPGLHISTQPVIISGDLSFVRSLKSLNKDERELWEKQVPEGERSEHIFKLVYLLKVSLGFGDGLVIKSLLIHSILEDKWPKFEERVKDIKRCLIKIKEK